MPVDFGKNTGREIPGVGVLLSGTGEALLRRQQDQQNKRKARPRQRGTMRESERIQVYVYNVGPFMRKLDTLGSIGVVVLPALEEKKVLQGLNVAGPRIFAGLPAEEYPGEPRGQWLEHDPDENLRWTDADGEVFVLKDFPGIDLALRVIGAHEQSTKNPYAASPFEQGCFVSTIPEQAEPAEPSEPARNAARATIREYEKAMIQYDENLRLWGKWCASVRSSIERFTSYAMRRGEEQSLAYSNGTYVRDEELYVLARIFNKTDREWNFLAGTSDTVVRRKCWNCKLVIDSDAATCGHCKERQVSNEEYEARRSRVMNPESEQVAA